MFVSKMFMLMQRVRTGILEHILRGRMMIEHQYKFPLGLGRQNGTHE